MNMKQRTQKEFSILIVAKSPEIINRVNRLSENPVYNLEFVGSNENALQKLREGYKHVVLIGYDIETNGGDIALKIKGVSPYTAVIGITSNEAAGAEAITQGMSYFVTEGALNHDVILYRLVALAIENQEGMHDGLTGLFKREMFDRTLERELGEAKRSYHPDSEKTAPLSLILLDVDDFKSINDKYRHPAGDHVLKQVAEELTRNVRRAPDFVARYGGEEFGIILPNTNYTSAGDIAERIRTNIGGYNFLLPDRRVIQVTISGGFTTYQSNRIRVADPRVMLDFSDRALYKAKVAGKNRVVGVDELEFG